MDHLERTGSFYIKADPRLNIARELIAVSSRRPSNFLPVASSNNPVHGRNAPDRKLKLFFIFYAFGDDVQPQILSESNNGFDDLRVFILAADTAYKRTADL